MGFWKKVDPVGAVADFRTVFRQAGHNRWRVAAVAAAATLALFSSMFGKGQRIEPRPPEVTFITSFQPDRSDAEIEASNLANERVQSKLRAEQAKREEEVRNIYKSIGRASGMDVDAIERRAAAERAAEQRKQVEP